MLQVPPHITQRQLESGRVPHAAINRLARPGMELGADDRLELNQWAARRPLAPQLSEQGELVWVSQRPLEAGSRRSREMWLTS